MGNRAACQPLPGNAVWTRPALPKNVYAGHACVNTASLKIRKGKGGHQILNPMHPRKAAKLSG